MVDGLGDRLQFGLFKLQILVLVELDEHGAGKEIIEAPDMAKRLHRAVRIDRKLQPRLGEDMRVGGCGGGMERAGYDNPAQRREDTKYLHRYRPAESEF